VIDSYVYASLLDIPRVQLPRQVFLLFSRKDIVYMPFHCIIAFGVFRYNELASVVMTISSTCTLQFRRLIVVPANKLTFFIIRGGMRPEEA
jgi:hypothetical protein